MFYCLLAKRKLCYRTLLNIIPSHIISPVQQLNIYLIMLIKGRLLNNLYQSPVNNLTCTSTQYTSEEDYRQRVRGKCVNNKCKSALIKIWQCLIKIRILLQCLVKIRILLQCLKLEYCSA